MQQQQQQQQLQLQQTMSYPRKSVYSYAPSSQPQPQQSNSASTFQRSQSYHHQPIEPQKLSGQREQETVREQTNINREFMVQSVPLTFRQDAAGPDISEPIRTRAQPPAIMSAQLEKKQNHLLGLHHTQKN